jgi:type III secretion protein U
MSSNRDSSAQKDHRPTPRRLRKAREEGDVAFSGETSAALDFVVVITALWVAAASALSLLRGLWLHLTAPLLIAAPDFFEARLQEVLVHAGLVLLWVAFPLLAAAALAGVLGSFVQVGGLMAWKRLTPRVERMNPVEGFKRIFSTESLFNLLKLVVRTILLCLVMYAVLRSVLPDVLRLGYLSSMGIAAVGARIVLEVFAWSAVVFVVMAAVDYAHMRYEFIKRHRMSIDDLRREHKEDEGDPTTRARRRGTHFELAFAGVALRVARASAVIHSNRIAVALQYLGPDDLPRVVARGEGAMAHRIRRHAVDALVPVEEDARLAEQLYEQVALDRHIPRSLYEPVARLLRWAQGRE